MMLVSENDLPDEPRVVVAKSEFFGNTMVMLAGLPRRLYSTGTLPPPLLADNVNVRRTKTRPSAVAVASTHTGPWLAVTSRAQQTAFAWLLIAEDPQHRLDVSAIAPLKHQRTLVEHVLASPNLQRVLIGDEVGLGKTIEAALIAQRLREANPAIRILYLAPAKLVSNVVREWRHFGMDARRFTATDADARPATDLIVAASIHRSVLDANRDQLLEVPWDVIIADECHHLSDYGSGNMTRSFRLVRDLVRRQPASGRLILMSGTPHQGNQERFRNLLSLLQREDEDESAIAGRVIFRIKEKVTDWDGHPLFPLRDVRAPTVVSLGKSWKTFYDDVADLYSHSDSDTRAGGWAKSQALQWVASSMKAGVAYLARLSMRRLGWTLNDPSLAAALTALAPYERGGQKFETAETVFEVFRAMAPLQADDDPENDTGEQSPTWQPDPVQLADLLKRGAELIRATADDAKWEAMRRLIREAGSEKVVLFCQPVETVSVVAEILKATFEEPPAIIVGGQSDSERQREVDRFLRPDGARFLVSSRAGGEGINLQVARRLIHVDVPWNPMDMEQRVGRVHRFGSRLRILVDTLVVGGTREERAYELARNRLRIITQELALSPSDREALFSRVMSLVPPDELQGVMNELGDAPDGDTPIGKLVEEGYKRWREFTETYSGGTVPMHEADGGTATWDDLREFLTRHAGAEPGESAAGTVFRMQHGDSIAEAVSKKTIRVFGKTWVCDANDGLPVHSATGSTLPRIGLNSPEVATMLLNLVRNGPVAGSIRLPATSLSPALLTEVTGTEGCAALVFVRQHLQRTAVDSREERLEIRIILVGSDGMPRDTESQSLVVLRSILSASRVERPKVPSEALALLENEVWQSLLSGSVSEGGDRFAAVWPVACFLVSPAS